MITEIKIMKEKKKEVETKKSNLKKNNNTLENFKSWVSNIFAIDLRSLAAFRIAFGVGILADLALRLGDLAEFYTDYGLIPRYALVTEFSNINRWSLHAANGQLWFISLLFIINAIIALFLIAGYKTRIASVLAFIFLFSLHNRNEFVLQGGDNMFHIMAFFAMFLPLGARFSLDHLWNPIKKFEGVNKFSNLFSFSYLAQTAIAFSFAGLLKAGPEWTQTLLATSFAGNVNYLSTVAGRFVIQFTVLSQMWTAYLKWTEVLMPVLMFFPYKNDVTRIIGFVLLFIMLVGCGLGLQIALFPIVWIISLIPFLPSLFWDITNDWAKKLNKNHNQNLTFYYDESCLMCTSAACALENKVTVKTTQSNDEILKKMLEENTMTVEDEKGHRYYHFDALIKLIEINSVTFWLAPILKLGFIRPFGQAFYRFLAKNRYKISNFINNIKPIGNLNLNSIVLQICCVILIFLSFSWNLQTLENDFRNYPSPSYQPLFFALGLNQRWDMFAPTAVRAHGWIEIPGVLTDGTQVDVFHLKQNPPKFVKDYEPPIGMRSQGWRKYLTDFLPNTSNPVYQRRFAEFMCRRWEKEVTLKDNGGQLKSFEIYQMRQITLEDAKTLTEPEKVLLWSHQCIA
jgi:predicted DCC family thiol-disulfide oxidoreductase YuxK